MHWKSWWDSFVHFVSTWGSNGLVDTLLTLTVVFSRKIISFLSKFFQWISAIVRKDRKYYKFEKDYLTWIINRHRYLGLLPARVVATRWGEGRRIVDLEKVYVTLQVSAREGDQDEIRTSKNNISWRKQPWFYPLLKYYQGINVFLLILSAAPTLFIITFHSSSFFIITFHSSSSLWPITAFLTVLLACTLFIRWRILRRGEETYQPGDLGLVINRYKHLVIRGDPGSGKTTLLRYLAVTCARTLRDDKKQEDTPDLVKKRLLWSTRPFPILVTLRRHNDVGTWGQEKQLLNTFFEEMPVELRKQCPKSFFERQLKKRNCLILLDAFDELGSPESRAAMARRIRDFLAIYNHPGNRVVVTTRIVGYEGQLDRDDFQIRTVQNLRAGEIRALVKQRYRAIALSETAGWLQHNAAPVLQDMQQRSERLIKKIESTPRLAQLATNPLLLSLIVLVHYVKLELPQERVLLYRDCVEILAEQWQRSKNAEIDMVQDSQAELTLPQKLGLLQALALMMQQQRKDEKRQTLLPRVQVQEIIARKLPDILGNQLPTNGPERQEMCRRKAEAWISGIQVESGILVEQGLDEAGEPLIGFSHLTFQEYLAAVAINEDVQYKQLLRSNLLQPAWSEVVLLYIALTRDATADIAYLLDLSVQPAGVLMAGSCVAERVRYVKNEVQQLTLEKLKIGFEQADSQTVISFGQVLAAIGGDEVTSFMRAQMQSTVVEKRLEAIKALGHIKSNDMQIKDVQDEMVKFVEIPNDIDLAIAARESLALIGDPRFTGKEPVLVSVPQQLCSIASSPKGWKELIASPEWVNAKKLWQKLPLIARAFDYQLFVKIHPLRHKLPHKHVFEIGKYLVTNIEYAHFVKATKHRMPRYWVEGTFPLEKATHPVTGITPEDASMYCKWLSGQTGKVYRLPTEWEWEWVAAGSQRWRYPWGDQFDKNKCNTKEVDIGETTPVGSYLSDVSQYGVTDVSGNACEITNGCSLTLFSGKESISRSISRSILTMIGLKEVLSLLVITSNIAIMLVSLVHDILLLYFIIYSILIVLLITLLVLLTVLLGSEVVGGVVLRGGAFNTPSDQATCFSRRGYSSSIKGVGFRYVRES